jgi:hypothetical protein
MKEEMDADIGDDDFNPETAFQNQEILKNVYGGVEDMRDGNFSEDPIFGAP